MRVANSSQAAIQTSATAAPAARPRGAGHAETTPAPRQPRDLTVIMGVPEAELTPKVGAALARLMGEVGRLREDLALARTRIDHLERLADQDPLIPIANRRAFVRELSRRMSFAERYATPGSVLYFDVNGMKQINDDHGHAAGDAMLGHVAEILSRTVRGSDVVGRLGGDEFGVILAQSDRRGAVAKAAELAAAVRARPLLREGRELPIEVAYGIHTFSGREDPDAAIEAADRAMYAHKHTLRLAASRPAVTDRAAPA